MRRVGWIRSVVVSTVVPVSIVVVTAAPADLLAAGDDVGAVDASRVATTAADDHVPVPVAPENRVVAGPP